MEICHHGDDGQQLPVLTTYPQQACEYRREDEFVFVSIWGSFDGRSSSTGKVDPKAPPGNPVSFVPQVRIRPYIVTWPCHTVCYYLAQINGGWRCDDLRGSHCIRFKRSQSAMLASILGHHFLPPVTLSKARKAVFHRHQIRGPVPIRTRHRSAPTVYGHGCTHWRYLTESSTPTLCHYILFSVTSPGSSSYISIG